MTRRENWERRASGRPVTRRSGNVLLKCLLGLVLLLAVVGGLLSFVNIGGGLILDIAQKTLKEQLNLDLTASGVSGNPVRGYTLHDFALAIAGGDKVLSAKSLSARVNFGALLRGVVRLAEVAVGGVEMDLDQFIADVQKIKLPESEGGSSEIPVDRISLVDSRFTSKWGTVDVAEVGANIRGTVLDVDVDGRVNGIPVKGGADLDVSNGVLINRSDVSFGRGKILATGGVQPVSPTDKTNALDLRGSVQGLNLKELTALWPAVLRPDDYDGTAGLNLEASGTSETLKLSGTVSYNGTKISGYPVERVEAGVSYSGGRVTVSDIQASILNVPINGEMAIATHPGEVPSVMLKLDASDAALDGLDKALRIPELKGLGGRIASFSANIQGPANALNGTVNLSAPKVSYEGKAVTNIAAQLKLAKGDTASINSKFNFEGAQGYIQGSAASLLTAPRLDLTGNLNDLDVGRVADMIPDSSQYGLAGKLTAVLSLKGSLANPVLSGTLSSPALSGWGQKLDKPSVAFGFANNVLTLQKSSGTLNGMPINLSGTVGPLTSSAPDVNINATVTISPAALKAYVPDIGSYGLKGNVNAGVKLQGKLPSPSVNLVASSANLQALGMLSAKDIEVTTALGGDLTKLDKISLNARAGSLTASGVTFSDLTAKVEKDGDRVTLSSLGARSGSGSVKGSGTASLAGAGKLDLAFALDKLALGPLAAASGLNLKGTLTGSLKVSGTASDPAITFTGSAPSVTAEGLTLTNLAADVSGTAKSLKLNNFRAEVEGAPLTATGAVQLSPALNANIAIRGKGLDLAALTKDYPDLKGQLAGKADLAFDFASSAKGNSGKGSLTSSAVRAFGLNLSGVNLPLSLSGNTFASSGGTAKAYGGTAKNTLTYDLSKSSFTEQLEANGVDVNALLQDVTGGLGGKITGQGKLSLKLSGSVGKKVSYSGSGQFSMGSGGITGFKWLDLTTSLYGTKGIQYANVTAPFAIQTGKLILKAGAIANAPKNNPLYIYAKLPQDGAVNFDTTLNIVAEGSLNYQLINALVGGGKGSLEGLSSVLKGGNSLEQGLKQVLGGGVKGAKEAGAEADFRVVSLRIAGKAASPSLTLLKLGESTKKSAKQDEKDSSAKQSAAQQKQSQKQQAVKKEEAVKKASDKAVDKLVDALIPGSKKQQKDQGSSAKQQVQPAQQKSREDQAKDKLKEELSKGLQKGLGGLFKK